MQARLSDSSPARPLSWAAQVHAALMPDYNRPATAYWWAMVTLGAVLLALAAVSAAAWPADVLLQVLLGCGIAMLAGIFPVRVPGSKSSFAAGEIFIFLLLLMHGVPAAMLAAAAEAFTGSARTTKRWTSRIASPAMAAIAIGLVGTAWQAGTSALRLQGWFSEAVLMLSAMLLALLYFVVNTTLITLVITLKRNERLRPRALLDNFGWAGITYAGSALVASLLFLTFQRVGSGVLMAAAPIIAMLLTTLHFYFRQRETDNATQLLRVDVAEREAEQAAQHARALEVSERRFHSAFSHAAIGMALVSIEGQVLQANPALCTLLGQDEAHIVGRRLDAFLHGDDVPVLAQLLLQVITQSAEVPAFELRCHREQGDATWVSMHGALFSERNSSAPCLILQAQDISARRQAESRLNHIAYHDALTGLANRARFGECLARAIERTRRDPAFHFAVMYLDFDRFKLINDTLGHSAGDAFLVTVARRIAHLVRPHDTVGRLGGDEFAILVEQLDSEQSAVTMAERLQESLRLPYAVAGTEVNSSASIGITYSSIGYDTPDEVLRDADIAMYRAKAGGRARHEIFDASLRAQIADQVTLESDLRRAIANDQLTLAYQPIFDLADGRIVGFEALARWMHPQRGAIGPDQFIPIAEESGQIGALTEQVLSRACRQLRDWQSPGGRGAGLRMHVNVSGSDLCRVNFAAIVTKALLHNGLAPSQLTLEITESTLMTHLEQALHTMTRLREIGVGLSVDDFGTGYSSLAYLSTLPITSLKIDRSFVDRLQDGTQNAAIVRAIVTLGASLGKAVIAEGIETSLQMSHLRELGSSFGQGYLLARPLGAVDALAMLDQQLAAAGPSPLALLSGSDRGAVTIH